MSNTMHLSVFNHNNCWKNLNPDKFYEYVQPLLQLDLNDRTRGNDMKLVKNHVRYDMRKYFFTCRIIHLWNSLPAHVVHASSVNDFKNKLDAYWST